MVSRKFSESCLTQCIIALTSNDNVVLQKKYTLNMTLYNNHSVKDMYYFDVVILKILVFFTKFELFTDCHVFMNLWPSISGAVIFFDSCFWYIWLEFRGICASFGSTYTKIGTIQRRLAWPLRKDDTQNREAFHIFAFFFQMF